MNHLLRLKGCRQHNLKNLSLDLPKQAIIAVVGVSGSGKSSLAFDTIFAEGQRRYLEYLSIQTRSLIKQLPKPEVDLVEGLSPTLAISQGKQSLYSHGNVATYTDIYDFLSLLYTHIAEQHSPMTGKKLTRYSRQEIIDLILRDYPSGMRLQLLAPIKLQHEPVEVMIKKLQQMGFIRFKLNQQEWLAENPLPSLTTESQIEVIVDRLEMKEGIRERLSSSVETAMDLSQGILKIQEGREGPTRYLTEVFVCPETSYAFAPLTPADFNFNSPHGACTLCQGRGGQDKVNLDLLFWDPQIPLVEQVHLLLDELPRKTAHLLHLIWTDFTDEKGITDEIPLKDISSKTLQEILHGSLIDILISTSIENETKQWKTQWKGLIPLFEMHLQDKKIKDDLCELDFIEWQVCPACKGGRLKPESLACLIQGKGIHQLCQMTVSELIEEIGHWQFKGKQALLLQELLPPVQTRLRFLEQVGLGYLELNRQGKTLSGGEIQRIQLASQIGAKLSGIIYILDEPSLGLHRQDIQYLHQVIHELKNLGNTVILVEHEPSLISQADHLIELGPGAGLHGGQLIFQGHYSSLLKNPTSPTGQWMSGHLSLPIPTRRSPKRNKLCVQHANLHNLKDLSLQIPLGCLVAFCGVSGSGKSTLVRQVIAEEVQKHLQHCVSSPLVKGLESIKRVIISHKQNESFAARSMSATFMNIMTPLRQLFAETKLAKARGYTPSRFSLNKRGGRCEACEGLGQIRVSMQLMPDIFIPCEVCQGLRYNYETLQVTWENRNIAEVLALSAEEALHLFRYIPVIADKLQLMNELGLDYLTLGQSFNTLSSGEIQRMRLVADISIKSLEPTLYILDEPSAGLHFQDIEKLVQILHRLVDKKHSVFVVEHHLDMLRQADWLIELGPGGGPKGGYLIFEGSPEKILSANTPTGRVLSKPLCP